MSHVMLLSGWLSWGILTNVCVDSLQSDRLRIQRKLSRDKKVRLLARHTTKTNQNSGTGAMQRN